jgi:hypothetical protein
MVVVRNADEAGIERMSAFGVAWSRPQETVVHGVVISLRGAWVRKLKSQPIFQLHTRGKGFMIPAYLLIAAMLRSASTS